MMHVPLFEFLFKVLMILLGALHEHMGLWSREKWHFGKYAQHPSYGFETSYACFDALLHRYGIYTLHISSNCLKTIFQQRLNRPELARSSTINSVRSALSLDLDPFKRVLFLDAR